MFQGRADELWTLQERYASGRFEFLPVYGRRKMGKTALLKKFAEGKNAVYYSAQKGSLKANLSGLAKALTGVKADVPDMDTVLEIVRMKSEKERFLLIIDGFTNLRSRDDSVPGALKRFIDENRDSSKLFLILCGSSMNMMMHGSMGERSFLCSMRTGNLKIKPLSFQEARPFITQYSLEDQIRIYAMTGGVPLYLEQFSGTSLKDDIIRNFMMPGSFFPDEAFMTLAEDFENPVTYYPVFQAMAGGSSRNSEISQKADVSPALTTRYLNDLISVDIVSKEHPVDNPDGKSTRYRIDDEFLKTYFKYIQSGCADLSPEEMPAAADRIISGIQTEAGYEFEKICAAYLRRRLRGRPGKWWGSDPVSKRQEEIDIVITVEEDGRKIGYFVECKYRNEKVGEDVLDTLVTRSALVKGYDVRRHVICSKAGFEEGLEKRDVLLLTLEDMLEEPGR